MRKYLAQVSFGDFLHLDENHRRDLLGEEGFLVALVLDTDLGFATFVDDIERPMLHVGLNGRVVKTTPDQTFGVKHSVVWIHCHLNTVHISQTLTSEHISGDVIKGCPDSSSTNTTASSLGQTPPTHSAKNTVTHTAIARFADW